MADKKISQLTSATTPLAGTEVLPIVQSSTTVKVAVSDLTAGRSVSATQFTPTGGSATGNTFYLPTTNTLGFTTNGSERVRIDSSGNVGVGTTAPANAIEILRGAATNAYVSFRGNNNAVSAELITGQASTSEGYIYNRSNAAVIIGTNNAERMRIAADGSVGIGTVSPTRILDVSAADAAPRVTSSTGTNQVSLTFSNTGGNFWVGRDDSTGGYFGTGTAYSALVWAQGAYPLVFATNNTERMRIDSSGNVLVTGVGGLGYGTGSGGAVTQVTSRTTGVTLNKSNGAITLVSAAGTTTWQTFTVTNSVVAATDTVIVNQKSGTDLYQIFVTNVAAGSFKITFATTGGTTTEQPVFNFAVIKAVTS